MAGKQVAPEVKGEFSKGNLTEYPEVQRKDQKIRSKQRLIFYGQEQKPAGSISLPAVFVPSTGHPSRPHALS